MLDEKLKMLVDEYLIDFNGTRAYKAVWGEHVTDNTAAVEASKHLRKPKVTQYLQDRIKERERRTEITQDDVVRSLKMILDANVIDVVNVKGQYKITLKDISEIPKELQYAIKSIKPSKDGIEVEFYDKLRAVELLGKHLGMFTDKFEVTSDLGVTIVDDIPKGDDVE